MNPYRVRFAMTWLVFGFSCLFTLMPILAYFTDGFAILFGKMATFNVALPGNNHTLLGKVICLGYLPLIPLFLIVWGLHYDKAWMRVLGIVASLASVVFFYVFAGPFLASFEHEVGDSWISQFMCDFKDIYIWYTTPFFYLLAEFALVMLFLKAGSRPVLFPILCVIVYLLAAIGLPLLIGVVGAIVALLLGIGIIVGGLFITGKVLESVPQPERYVTDDGTVLTYHGGNDYSDSAGNHYTSDDGGRTVRRK